VRPRALLWTSVLFSILAMPPLPSLAQQRGVPPPDRTPVPEDQATTRAEQEAAKKANQQRQADLKRDTDKLFQLATELKEYVDKTNEGVLSLEVLKKSEEIEKLAHSVKEKMKGPR